MPSEPANQAAAGVISDLLAEEVNEGAATADALMPDPTQPEDLIPNEAPEAVAEGEQPQDEVGLPEINWDIPEELKDELAAPDFDLEDEEPEWQPEAQTETQEDEYEDPEKAKLRKQLANAQKKLAWAEEQKAKQGRKLWADEARKYFQFSNPDIIQAKSRRAFLKEAAQQHAAAAKVVKPVFDQLAAQKEKIREEIRAEERARAEQMWGAPTAGPAAAHQPENTQTLQRQRLQAGQSLTSVLKNKLVRGEVNL